VERPWERGGFRHPRLKPWVAENRARLESALLTMGRAWFAEGKPEGSAVIGGFEGWSHTIGGVLEVAGVSGFLANLSEMYERAADGTRDWSAFLEAWRVTYGDEAHTTKQVAADLHDEANDKLRDALPDEFGTIVLDRPDKGLTRKIGKAFAKREGRRHGPEGLHLARAGSKANATQWTVRPAPDGPAEKRSFISLITFSHPSRSRPLEGGTEPKQTNETNKLILTPDTSGSEPDTNDSEVGTSSLRAAPRESGITDEQEQRISELVREGMQRSWAET
jgi:hypothetical protein